MSNIKICVIGAGSWGQNHIKTLSELKVLGGVVDTNINLFNNLNLNYPSIKCYENIESTFEENFDGYVIASPASTHCLIAKKIIQQKKPILIEKPLALSLKEANEIKSVYDKNGGKVLVGHLLRFHPAINKMKDIIDKGKIGEIQYIYSNRLNLGQVRKKENVFWSFAPHDISLFQYFVDLFPVKVESLGGAFLQKNIHDTTVTYLKYKNGVQGHIYVSWLHPFKEHRLVIIGSKGSLHFDESKEKKILLYEKETIKKVDNLSLKKKPIKVIHYEESLPLTNQLKYFIDAINGKNIEISTIEEGIDVVKILEMASTSLLQN